MKLVPVPVIQERAQRAKYVTWTPKQSHHINNWRLPHYQVAQILKWYGVSVSTMGMHDLRHESIAEMS